MLTILSAMCPEKGPLIANLGSFSGAGTARLLRYQGRVMRLIIVARSKPETYERLRRTFADDINVEVIWDRRTRERRRQRDDRGPERRSRERRQLAKTFNGRDYIVIYIAQRRAS
jgi:phospholipid N-methyltransferase